MQRTRGSVFGVVFAIAATGLLAACGGNDSTASSTPTLTRTTAASQPPAASSSAPQAPAPAPEPEQSPSVAPERPQPIPADSAPPADTSKLSDKDKKYLDSLKQQGITPSSPDIALSIGAYVCQGGASGVSDSDLTTFVNAMAGSDPTFDPAKMPVEKAGQIYISAAKQTYCQ